ncbi:DMT family transporter [Micromonospora cathayae]|uniref:Multidrug efflux SMR transporter n=1 Tax=Micromonospora cathayae TaxID=3028804 RepID=A0ABY7ZTE4_9ACTN|nr:multidrug efflux SMR transporter [Micromonospora sp. HUAS 3]WDZ86245.1 multidrug efflux SMR transporter [Micromonospora sp. HUAS 3]
MAYVLLALAIVAEVVGTSLMKATEGFTRLWPTLGLATAYLVSFYLFSLAVRDIPVSVAYAFWAGIGTAAIAAIGAAFLGEPLTLTKVVGIALVAGGLVVLNLGGTH